MELNILRNGWGRRSTSHDKKKVNIKLGADMLDRHTLQYCTSTVQ